MLYGVENLVDGSGPELTTLEGFVERAQSLVADLIQIRLGVLQLGALSLAPFLLGALYLALRRTERLVAVTGVATRDTLIAVRDENGLSTPVRHDSEMWTTKSLSLRRNPSTSVKLPGGKTARVPTENIADTGF